MTNTSGVKTSISYRGGFFFLMALTFRPAQPKLGIRKKMVGSKGDWRDVDHITYGVLIGLKM